MSLHAKGMALSNVANPVLQAIIYHCVVPYSMLPMVGDRESPAVRLSKYHTYQEHEMSEIKGSSGLTSGMLTTTKSGIGNYSYVCSVDYASLTTYLTFEGVWSVTKKPVLPLIVTTAATVDGTMFGFCFEGITSYSSQCTVNSEEYGSQILTISVPRSISAE
jgi:hypothetical protein